METAGRDAAGTCGELAGARTQDQRLKRAMLYQLSYELVQGRSIQIITAPGLQAYGRRRLLAG